MALPDVRTAVPIAREVVEGRPLQQMQEVGLRSASALNALSLQPGALLTFVFDGVNPTRVAHGLGRTPRGWISVDNLQLNALQRVAWDEGTIALFAVTADTVRVWVF